MRFAIFSDIHANLQAWEAVLADIQTQGADTLVCLGDVVGYGPMPGVVLESVYHHTDNFVLGNHDAVVGGRIDAATFNEHARYVIQWTAEQLGEEGAAFFAQVPLTLRGENLLFTHGDAARPGHFDYVVKAEDARPSFQACRDEIIFFGHTHDPGVFACANTKGIIDKLPGTDVVLKKGRRYMVNPGSVGDPRTATDLRASYCLYDDTTRRLSFRRVEFDVEAYREDLRASGLELMPYFLRVIDAGSRRPEEDEELAMVQDHREEVTVDESMTVQPRALVTVGSPMANRAKLHFGYGHVPAQRRHPGMHPPHSMRPQHPGMHPMPGAASSKGNVAAVLIVGLLLGVIGLIVAMSYTTGTKRAEVGELAAKEGAAKKLVDEEEGWEEPEREPEPDEPVEEELVGGEPGVAPVFTLSSLAEQPFEAYAVDLPDGVALVDTEFGGVGLKFGAGAQGVEIRGVDEVDFGGSISVAAWIKLRPAKHDRVIFARMSGKTKWMYMVVTAADDEKPGCVVFGGEGLEPKEVRSSSKKRVDDGEWHFVMGMHDEEEGLLRVYLDGVISISRKTTGTFRPMSDPISVGVGDFIGEIYGLRIYDWPLHTKDMQQVYEWRK